MGLLDDIREKARSIAGLLSDSYQTGAQIYFPNKADVSARKKVAGLLSDRAGDAYDYLGKRASVIAADPLGELARAVDNAMGGEYNRQLNQRATLGLDAVAGSDQTNASLQSELNRKLLDVALNGITVWHGSPHKFDKFDMSKIGTGEGAQAYGHGLYMAESPDVARSYKNSDYSIEYKGNKQRYNNSYGGEDADAALFSKMWRHFGEDEDKAQVAMAVLNKQSPNPKEYLQELLTKNAGTKYESAIRDLLDNASFPSPSMYKVDIPDEAVARMLDWDKPLSQQAPEVQAALEKSKNKQLRAMLDYAKVPYIETAGGEAKTMGEAFRLLNLNLHGKSSADSAKASALLAKQGIPGIRYLDGGSRAGGQGTSNYVLFSDQLPRILEVNGKPTGQTPWAAGEWNGLLGQ